MVCYTYKRKFVFCLLVFLILACICWSQTGDVIDQIMEIGDIACGDADGIAMGATPIQVDMDGNGVLDTQVLIVTALGWAKVLPEEELEGYGLPGLVDGTYFYYFHPYSTDTSEWEWAGIMEDESGNCPNTSGPHRAELKIYFINMLTPGFVWNNPNTWTYKSVPAVSIKLWEKWTGPIMGLCIGSDLEPCPYYNDEGLCFTIVGFTELEEGGNLIEGIRTTLNSHCDQYYFTHPAGIKELYVISSCRNNLLDDLILWETPPQTGAVVPLFDVSGSMGEDFSGQMPVPEEQRRITLAKNAGSLLVETLYDNLGDAVSVGIASFPYHPWSSGVGCNGQVISPVSVLNQSTYNEIITSIIPSLYPSANTPLVAGIDTARQMFGTELNKSIVLLSDGYQNCPSLSVTDDEFDALVDSLNNNDVRVFTIGFGNPEDPDQPFLSQLASRTYGHFHNVTNDPDFDPDLWNPSTDLSITYEKVCAASQGSQMAADPFGIISAGQTVTGEVGINKYDHRINVVLCWETPQKNRLGLSILSSNGQAIPLAECLVHNNSTNTLVTIPESVINKPGFSGSSAWKIQIDGKKIPKNGKEPYQYCVIVDSDLKLNVRFNKNQFYTGDTVEYSVSVSANGKVLKKLKDISLTIAGPGDGIGNWFKDNKIPLEKLKKYAASINSKRTERKQKITISRGDSLNLVQVKARYIREELKKPFPGQTKPSSKTLKDSGKAGDEVAKDGVFMGTFTGLKKEGTYTFLFKVKGVTEDGTPFTREVKIDKYVMVSPEKIGIGVVSTPITNSDIKAYQLIITPRDKFGNYAGQGYGIIMDVSASAGKLIGVPEYNLEGSYIQKLYIPSTVKPEDVQLRVRIGSTELIKMLK